MSLVRRMAEIQRLAERMKRSRDDGITRGIALLERRAAQGDADAQRRLARVHELLGIARDRRDADG